MKKIFVLFQIVLLVFSLCACTKEDVNLKDMLPEKEVIAYEKSNPLMDKIVYTSVDQLIEASDCIIEGEVLDNGTEYSIPDEYLGVKYGMMYFKVKVLKVVKGNNVANEIIIAQKGPTTDAIEVKYKKGEHIIAFLYQYENGIPGTEQYTYSYMSVAHEDGSFRVININYKNKNTDVVQCFGSKNILQYDGKSLSEFSKLLK